MNIPDEIVRKAYTAASPTTARWGEIRAALEAVADDLVKAEREACAKLCEDNVWTDGDLTRGGTMADLIRARRP